MMLLEFAFWGAVGVVVYAYLGYPLCLWVLSRVVSRDVRRADWTPSVSFVITAHNEARRIGEKIENTLALRYPPGRMEIIVASDCSTDGTDDIVRAYGHAGVRLVRNPERRGKEAAQRLAVEASSGEILVFSDVATVLEPDAVEIIVRNFADPTVGCVSSTDRLLDVDGRVSGEGAYVRYEMWLRSLETRVNTLVGLSGSFFAARREVCHPWTVDQQSDFRVLLNSIERGLRGVADPKATGYYRRIADERREFDRKVRTVVRGLAVLGHHLRLLNPLRYGLFAWQLFSHKLCRWLVPAGMLVALVSNVAIADRSALYAGTLALQAAFYVVALIGLVLGPEKCSTVVRLPAFLVMANAAVLQAWYRFLRGERMVAWTPSQR